jgi:hypothetical protein
MTRPFVGLAIVMTLSLSVSLAYGQRRESGGSKSRESESKSGSSAQRESEGKKEGKEQPGHESKNESQGASGTKSGDTSAPGGEWSERTHGGKQSSSQPGNHNESQASGEQGAAAVKHNEPQASGAQGAAAAKHNEPQASGAQGAAAVKRNEPQGSGAQGAAAGAAAAKHNEPQASGAQGAAAGAAAVKHNEPQASGAQGAAAGAAVAKHNQPQYSGAQGAAAGAAVANRNAPAVSGAAGATAGYAAVRNSFHDPNLYGQKWYGSHQGAWAASGWTAGTAWQPSTWGAVAGLCGYGNVTPVSYDYGVNVTAQNGNVTVNGQTVGTTAEFSQQAADLAAAGAKAEATDTDKWLPLGVFAMVRDEHQQPQFILQLAINRQGILRGNYTDEISDNTMAIHGAADKTTQRAAWTIGNNNKGTVMEAGLEDLTESEAPALIHKNGKTDHWILVRLEQPSGAQK